MSRSIKTLICCVSILIIFFTVIAIDWACGPEIDPYDCYTSFFHNNVYGEKAYGSFYLDTYDYVFDDSEPVNEADVNAREWAKYLGNNVKPADVKKAMYGLRRYDDSVLIAERKIELKRLPDTLKNNTFLRVLTSGSKPAALAYYLFAKRIQNEANVEYSRWDPTPVDTPALRRDGFEALKRGNDEADRFIKLRYLYQAERLLHYSGNFKQAMQIYDKQIAGYNSESHIKGWALALKAGEERRLGDTVKAAYLFAKVFAEYPEKRVLAYKNFHYCSKPARQVEALTANDKERALIYGIDGFGDPELNLNYLRKVYHYDPSSQMVGVLLVREINKLENVYLTSNLYRQWADNSDIDEYIETNKERKAARLHLDSVKEFCIKLSADAKYPERSLGYLGAAYLTWMKGGRSSEGLDLLTRMNDSRLSRKLTDQQQLVKLLLTAQNMQELKTVNEAQLLPMLTWLDKRSRQEMDSLRKTEDPLLTNDPDYPGRFGASERDFYKLVLAQQYLKLKDTARAALCVYKSEHPWAGGPKTGGKPGPVEMQGNTKTDYISNSLPQFWQHFLGSSRVEQIIGWKKVLPASPYLQFLLKPTSDIVTNDLYELQGTAYLREHNYPMAIRAFKEMKKPYTIDKYMISDAPADPFISQVKDYPKVFSRKGSKSYDKLMYAKAMDSLLKKAQAYPAHASECYYKAATGFYNASTYGNAFYLISYDWSAYDYGRKKIYSYDDDYIKTKTAETYYLKARAASTNAEFKARCTFMAAKCRQKQVTVPSDDMYTDDTDDVYNKKVRHNTYFAELKKGYAQTAFYRTAVKDCSYLRDFLASTNKPNKK